VASGAGLTGGQHGGAGGRLVVWMTGDAGVVEDQHSICPVAGRQPHGMGGQLGRRDGREPTVGVAERGDAGGG